MITLNVRVDVDVDDIDYDIAINVDDVCYIINAVTYVI